MAVRSQAHLLARSAAVASQGRCPSSPVRSLPAAVLEAHGKQVCPRGGLTSEERWLLVRCLQGHPRVPGCHMERRWRLGQRLMLLSLGLRARDSWCLAELGRRGL